MRTTIDLVAFSSPLTSTHLHTPHPTVLYIFSLVLNRQYLYSWHVTGYRHTIKRARPSSRHSPPVAPVRHPVPVPLPGLESVDMTITPRTCLWPLTGALCISFALSMGLTYRSNGSCYAGVCSETHSPLQTRLQVAVWYLWLALSVTVLGFRSFKPWLRKFLNMRISVFGTTHKAWLSSILMALWISSLFGIITGIWWRELHRFYLSQGPDMVQSAGVLAAISLSGQWAALAFGLALTPVSRHSALGSFFKLSFSGTQKFHMMVSYLLITLVFVHTLLYLYWVGYWKTWPADKQALFPVYNPEHSNDEVYPGNKTALGKYRASLVFTGGASAFILLLIVITSNRFVRGRWFKIFYWVHTLSILSIIVAALHSSTLFYCIAPGIFMWLLDK